MKFKLSILLILVLAFVYSADCNTGYSDNLNIRVLDAYNSGLVNASVYIYYQLDQTSSKGYAYIGPFYTNENGLANRTIKNYETIENKVDCDIKLTILYDSINKSKTIEAESHPDMIDFNLNVYTLQVKVTDQDNNPLENAEVWANSFKQLTNSNGLALFKVPGGDVNLLFYYKGGKKEEIIELTSSRNYATEIYVNLMIIHVVDDNGNILDATVTVNGIEYQTKDGSLTITEIGEISPEVLVSYLGNEKSINVNLLQDPDYTVIFDRTPPQILSIDLDSSGEVMKLVITAEDPGKQPSGIELEGIIVRYQYEGEWITANVYKELGVYVGELTKTNPGSVVYFEVTIQDKEGLKQIQNGHFSIPSDNGGTNHSNGGNGDNGDGEGGFDLLTIGLVVIFIVILYIIIKKLMGSGE